MPRKTRKQYDATDFDLDVLSTDADIFRWFLLCYLFGKPIQGDVAVSAWRLFIEKNLDTPWAILDTSERKLVKLLHSGGYARYQYVTAHGLKICMEKLINHYDGSLHYMLEISENEDEFSKMIQSLHGVGPKVAEIFMRDTEEFFARRVD